MKKFGTIGHSFCGDAATALVMASAIMLASRNKRRATIEQAGPPTDTRTERQRWNDEVAARKVAKKGRK